MEDISRTVKGQWGKFFDFSGKQLITASYVEHHIDQEEWIKKVRDPECYEEEVCKPVFYNEVVQIIMENKDERASGIDGIPTKLLKNASKEFYEEVTALVNKYLVQGTTAECLNVGKMTLIDKKEPSMKISYSI